MIRAFIAIDVPDELKNRISDYIGGLKGFDKVITSIEIRKRDK